MTGAAVEGAPPLVSWSAFALVLVLMGALALLAGPGPLVGPVALALAAASSGYLGIWSRTRRSDGRALPLIVLGVYATASAPPSPETGLLAAGTALALLFWLSQDRESVGGASAAGLSLILPGTAVGIALVSALLLPVPERVVGFAAAVVAGTLVLIAWLYRTAWNAPPAGSSAS